MKMASPRINWLGLLSAIMIFVLFSTQFTQPPTPWWSLTIGSEEGSLVNAEVSPFLVNITVWGTPVDAPILQYVTLSLSIMFLITGLTMLLGSLLIKKSWAQYLIDFAYLKPALGFLFFLGLIFAISWSTGSTLQREIPLQGDLTIPYLREDAHLRLQTLLPVQTLLLWPFLLTIVTVIISITAKLYHNVLWRDAKTQKERSGS